MLAAALFAGCGTQAASGSSAAAESSATTTESGMVSSENASASGSYVVSEMALDTSDMFTDRDLDASYDEADAVTVTLSDSGSTASNDSVEIDGQTVTITSEGVYVFSGSLSDGQIIVEADDTAKVQIVLNGVDITSKTSAAVYVKSADKVFLTAAEGTDNTLINTDAYEADGDEEISAVVYAKDDLTINGTGNLTINAANGDGINAKDDLKLVDVTLTVDAADHAISANDSIRIASGTYNLTSETDGLHISNDEDGEKGYLYMFDGSVSITCGSDGVDASGMIQIDGGSLEINAGDDGIHSEAKLEVDGGTINITKCEEGLEGYVVVINDGDIDITSNDDGINATSGNGSNMMGGPGMQGGQQMQGGPGEMSQNGEMPQNGEQTQNLTADSMETENAEDGSEADNTETADTSEEDTVSYTYTGDVDLSINGGVITIDTEGDGIDSNGTITITGGETYISGPSNSGNGSMDVGDGYEATITGGIVVAAGADGMAENFGSSSTQGAILQSVTSTDGEVVLTDADGNELISFTPSKTYSSVLISCPGITQGETYILTTGGASTNIEMTNLIYGQSQGMGGAGMQGGKGMQDGSGMQDGGQMQGGPGMRGGQGQMESGAAQ